MKLDLFTTDYMLRVTAKDVSRMLGVSLASANRYIADIKAEYKIKRVFLGHLINYLKLSYETALNYSKLLKTTQNYSKIIKIAQNSQGCTPL